MTRWIIQQKSNRISHYSFEVGLRCFWNWREYEGYRQADRAMASVNLFSYYSSIMVF